MVCPCFLRSARLMSLTRAANRTIALSVLTALSGITSPLMLTATAAPSNSAPPNSASLTSASLTSDQCDNLSRQTSTAELRDQLDDFAIVPQENRIASDLTGLTWIGSTGAFFSATLRRDRVEQVICQSAPAIEDGQGSAEPNVLCSQIEMDMTLQEVQQALGSAGEELIGEDGFPLNNIRQWTDRATQQVAIVSFNNFGEMAGLSCFNPIAIAPEASPESSPSINSETF
jgi:hypothetical protein